MYSLNGMPIIEEDDQCYSCEHLNKSVACPLLEALGTGIAYLEGDVTVSACGFYKRFERHLKLL